MSRKEEWENNEELNIFREYVRIPSVHPNADYSKCVCEIVQTYTTPISL